MRVRPTPVLTGMTVGVALNASDPRNQVDATVQLSQVEANTDVPASAFEVEIPAGVQSLTVQELRESGPLREQ